MSLESELNRIADSAREASFRLAALKASNRTAILLSMAEELEARSESILKANAKDAAGGEAKGLGPALLDRLLLSPERIASMVKSLRQVAALADPLEKVLHEETRPNGLLIQKISVPIGVIAIIYESRPNVTADSAALCIKAGNAVILRGGSEAVESNLAIAEALQHGGLKAGLPEGALQFIANPDRAVIPILVKLAGKIDLVIPRGGEGLIRSVAEAARIPVIKHYKGVCHVFVDAAADFDKALRIVENAKCQRPGVCNALETLLVHEAIAEKFLPQMAKILLERGVELRGDETVCRLLPQAKKAQEADWSAEYLDLILAIRVVPDLEHAVDHIRRYGSQHSDSIVSESSDAQERFLHAVDSAVVYANASTRFTDGGEFGMGAEIGISTDKLHARGPMGVAELCSYKYVVRGTGQIR